MQQFWKKVGKISEKVFFGAQFAQKEDHYGPRPQLIFLAEITKGHFQFAENFYFIKISYVLTEVRIFFYLE